MPVYRALRFVLMSTLLMAAAGRAFATPDALQTIPALDVPRYLGTWYEIARYPNRFQKQCVADVQAQYSALPEGRIEVRNRCRKADGEMDEAIGVAKQVGDARSPKLKVRFAPAWLSFIPAVWGDYWVVDLDEGYQLAAVSEPQREYLWILSRTPQVDAQAYHALLHRLTRHGLDIKRLVPTSQTSPRR
jgi:apolipoprotein D and lipocalin family protein